MRNYELNERIEDRSQLATLFNKVLRRCDLLRIVSCPRTFEDIYGEHGGQFARNFYKLILYEKWMHGVIQRLREWTETIGEYFTEYGGQWKYYACAKRLSSIREYGGDDEDYDGKGNVITEGIGMERLQCHTVIADLLPDGLDIVRETTPEHLSDLATFLELNAQTTLYDFLKYMGNDDVTPGRLVGDEEGNATFVPVTQESVELKKISDSVEGEDLYKMVLFSCTTVNRLYGQIQSLDPFQDNREALALIQRVAQTMLGHDINKR